MSDDMVFIHTNLMSGNQVLVCERAGDGELTVVEKAGTGGLGGGTGPDALDSQGSLVYDTRHRLLFVVNAGSDSIAVLGGHRLQLRQVVPSGGSFPVSLALHGDLLYVLNAKAGGSIGGFRIENGLLHPIAGSTRSLNLDPEPLPPTQIGFSPDGRQLVVATLFAGLIDVFSVDEYGCVSASATSTRTGRPAPFAFTFDGQGRLLVVDAGDSTLTTYDLLPDGTAERIASTPDGGAAACWIVGSKGNFYVVNLGSNTISGYHVDPATGRPAVFNQTTTKAAPADAVITRDGRFLYVEVEGASAVNGYRINPDGSLTLVSTLPVPMTAQGIAAS